MTSPTVVDVVHTTGTNVNSLACTMPTHSTGDLLLAVITWEDYASAVVAWGANAASVTAGWVNLGGANSVADTSRAGYRLAYKVAESGSETLTISSASTTDAMQVSVYSIQGYDSSYVAGVADVCVESRASSGIGGLLEQYNIENIYPGALLICGFSTSGGTSSGTVSSTTNNGFTAVSSAAHSLSGGGTGYCYHGYKNGSTEEVVTSPQLDASISTTYEVTVTLVIPAAGVSPTRSRVAYYSKSGSNYVSYADNNAGATTVSVTVDPLTIELVNSRSFWFMAVTGTDLTNGSGDTLPPAAANGWYPLGNHDADGQMSCFYAGASTSDTTTFTVTGASVKMGMLLLLFQGTSEERPYARLTYNTWESASTSIGGIDLETTSANQLHLLVVGENDGSEDATPPSGYTEIADSADATNGQFMSAHVKRYTTAGSDTTGNVTLSTTNTPGFISILLSNPNESGPALPAQVQASKRFETVTSVADQTAYNWDHKDGQVLVLVGAFAGGAVGESSWSISTPAVSNTSLLNEYDAGNAWDQEAKEVVAEAEGSTVVWAISTGGGLGMQGGAYLLLIDGAQPGVAPVAVEAVANTASTSITVNFSNLVPGGCAFAVVLQQYVSSAMDQLTGWDVMGDYGDNIDGTHEQYLYINNSPAVSGGGLSAVFPGALAKRLAHAVYYNSRAVGGGLFFGSNF